MNCVCISESGSVFDFGAILALLKIPAVFFIVMLKTVVGIPAGVFHSMFSMVNMERFQLTPESNGYLLSYVGILTMVAHSPCYSTCLDSYIPFPCRSCKESVWDSFPNVFLTTFF